MRAVIRVLPTMLGSIFCVWPCVLIEDIIQSVPWTQHVPQIHSCGVCAETTSLVDSDQNKAAVTSPSARATSSFHLHLSLPRGFVRRFYFWLYRPSQKYLWGDQVSGQKRDMFLTLEPLADSSLAPRRDRLHARSPAAVALSVSSRPGRFLPLRAVGRRKSWYWFGVGRWRMALLLPGTGKSPPAVSQ